MPSAFLFIFVFPRTWFLTPYSEELSKAHIHPPWEDGIYVGGEKPGEKGPAKSVVLANRPEYPNEDYGERLYVVVRSCLRNIEIVC